MPSKKRYDKYGDLIPTKPYLGVDKTIPTVTGFKYINGALEHFKKIKKSNYTPEEIFNWIRYNVWSSTHRKQTRTDKIEYIVNGLKKLQEGVKGEINK